VSDLFTWFEVQLVKLPARGPTAEAIHYALNHRHGLELFVDDGHIEIDSNTVERTMRPIALSRKNALFCGSDDGGENWAAIASLIETCKLNRVEPQRYLTDLLTRLVNGWPQARIGTHALAQGRTRSRVDVNREIQRPRSTTYAGPEAPRHRLPQAVSRVAPLCAGRPGDRAIQKVIVDHCCDGWNGLAPDLGASYPSVCATGLMGSDQPAPALQPTRANFHVCHAVRHHRHLLDQSMSPDSKLSR
jgi:hypothetical protein